MLKHVKAMCVIIRRGLAIFALFIGLSPAQSQAEAARTPEIYFYPPPYRLADGTLAGSPLALGTDQLTTLFPDVKEMTGVVVMLPWSTVEPEEGHYDFSLIDTVLSYWKARNKKVVLGISTSGPPIKMIRDKTAYIQSETPAWVTTKVSSYQDEDESIGKIAGTGKVHDTVPAYWDPRFAPFYTRLIQELGRRYDGNATLSYVRIGTGRVGEDFPTIYGAHPEKAPNYDPMKWITYSQQIVEAYEKAFPHSQLEFDLGWVAWIYSTGDGALKSAADHFMEGLIHDHVFVTFNGWQNQAIQWYRNAGKPGFGPNRIMFYLDQRRRSGQPIGLEALTPMFGPNMQETAKLAELAKALQPKRLVFFGIDAAGISFVRNGPSASTSTAQQWMKDEKLKEMGLLSIRLLDEVTQK